jgi:predicted helicase
LTLFRASWRTKKAIFPNLKEIAFSSEKSMFPNLKGDFLLYSQNNFDNFQHLGDLKKQFIPT